MQSNIKSQLLRVPNSKKMLMLLLVYHIIERQKENSQTNWRRMISTIPPTLKTCSSRTSRFQPPLTPYRCLDRPNASVKQCNVYEHDPNVWSFAPPPCSSWRCNVSTMKGAIHGERNDNPRLVFIHKKNCSNPAAKEDPPMIIGAFNWKWAAAAVFEALLPELVEDDDESAVPGSLLLPEQVYLPLITALLSWILSNSEQLNWPDVCRLKAPFTWVKAGRTTLSVLEQCL